MSGGTGSPGAGSDGSAGMSCEPSVADAGSPPSATAHVPLNHRASSCCSSQRGPGPAPQPYSDARVGFGPDGLPACRLDSQCLGGPNGRCFPFEGTVGPGGCSYDECSSDSDCPSATPCICRRAPTDNAPNVCAPRGNCAVDSDCGPGGYCSPSNSENSCWGPSTYYCHTASDTCTNTADCPPVDAGAFGNISVVCAYDTQALHWACLQVGCYLP